MTEELIRCNQPSCQVLKPASEFVNIMTGGRTKICATCRGNARRSMKKNKAKWWPKRQEYDRKQKYGMNPGDYDRMLVAQEGGCAICKTPPGVHESYKVLAVDHNEQTGQVRGLLCAQCNVGIGMFQHNTKLLEKAIIYLDRFRDPVEL